MNTTQITVTSSLEIQKKIRSIWGNYLQLMLDCANDKRVKEDFLNNCHYYLNEKVGMGIPDDVQVEFDHDEWSWPVVYIKTDEKEIVVEEGALAITLMEQLISEKETDDEKKIEQRKTVNQQEKAEVTIDAALKKSHVVIKLPFLDI